MSEFTVYLPRYNYRIIYNYDDFTQSYPNSLITLALQSGENEIPIENPLVTPEILQLLQDVMTTDQYPYISNLNVMKILDYLGIDFPKAVYDSRYETLLNTYPNLDWNNKYFRILQYAIDNNFPELASYLFSMTDPDKHKDDDSALLNFIIFMQSGLASPEKEEIGVMLLQERKAVITEERKYVAYKGYTTLLKYI